MNGIVYKQWYSPRNEPDTPKYNVQHLKYIATRPGTIQNPDCGFGLWGQMGRDAQAGNIDNLKCAMAQMRRISKEHTVYRTVISLDEDTAIKKGFKGREEWQALVTKHAEAIAKQNNIDLRDFRWCASYHHERGHKLPMFMTPKHEVLTDDVLVKMLRELTLQCMNDPQLKLETKISQAFETKRAQESDGREESGRKTDDEPPAKEADEAKEDKKESEEFKAAYKYVSQKLYDMAVEAKGWDMQAQFLNVNNFLRAFCRMTSQSNGANNTIDQFFLLRELSKQARKERSLERKDSTNMWDVQF